MRPAPRWPASSRRALPPTLFLSADIEWMDYVQTRGLIDRTTRRDLLGNRLVLIAPASSKVALEIAPGFPLAAALGYGPPRDRRS